MGENYFLEVGPVGTGTPEDYGLQVGDRIVAIEDEAVRAVDDGLIDQLSEAVSYGYVIVKVDRNGETFDLNIGFD